MWCFTLFPPGSLSLLWHRGVGAEAKSITLVPSILCADIVGALHHITGGHGTRENTRWQHIVAESGPAIDEWDRHLRKVTEVLEWPVCRDYYGNYYVQNVVFVRM